MKRGTNFSYSAFPQGLPILHEGCTGLSSKDSPLDLLPNPYVSQVIAEVCPLRRTAVVLTNMDIQTLLGHEGVSPASIEDPSDQSKRNTGDMTLDFTVSSAPRGISKYSCNICGKKYSQRQGVSRHYQSVHNSPHSCLFCDFKWTRPYLYTNHLKMCHPDVNADEVLGKSAGSRCKSTIIGRDLEQPVYPLTIEPGQWGRAEPRQRPMAPLHTVTKDTHVPSSTKLPVGHNPQPELAEPTITSQKCEDSHGLLELFGTTDASSAFSSTEGCVQSVSDFVISIEDDQTRLVHVLYMPYNAAYLLL
jgi:hypothetical protein